MTTPAYCTILASNYLPSALTLSESLRRNGSEHPLVVFLTDAVADTELPDIAGVRWVMPASLDLDDRQVLDLAMSYDLVEFATALKPLVLQKLLEEFEQVVYLDPDTYVVSPMVELPATLDASAGMVLTPHYLEPVPAGQPFSEGHLLNVGVFNLGFCAVNRDAGQLLRWWWGHLCSECLHDAIAGLFVDQKWMDIGSVLFGATSLRHYGYNVGVANIHERPMALDADGHYIASSGDRLRLFHFHAFDPLRPQELYARPSTTSDRFPIESEPLQVLAREYAEIVLAKRALLGPLPPYRYGRDTTGRRISRRMRHAYRVAVQADPASVPSPFVPTEAADYERWRRQARRLAGRLVASDIAKGVRCALPEDYDRVKRRLPRLTRSLRSHWVEDSGIWS